MSVKLLTEYRLEFSKLKKNAAHACLSLHLSKHHIDENHVSRLIYASGVHIELDGSVPVESVASLIRGTKLELTCIFDAPDAVFLWTKVDDESFSNANPTLIIQRVQRIHAGKYTCTVTRPGAPEEAKSVELNILCKLQTNN